MYSANMIGKSSGNGRPLTALIGGFDEKSIHEVPNTI